MDAGSTWKKLDTMNRANFDFPLDTAVFVKDGMGERRGRIAARCILSPVKGTTFLSPAFVVLLDSGEELHGVHPSQVRKA